MCIPVWNVCICIIRQEVTKRETQSREDSELKIEYQWTDYHNKGWGSGQMIPSMCGNEEMKEEENAVCILQQLILIAYLYFLWSLDRDVCSQAHCLKMTPI